MARIDERLRHDADRVGEIDDPCVRRTAPTRQLGQIQHHGHRPQRLREPARAGGLLADRPEAKGERLIGEPRRLTADAKLDEDEAGAVDGGLGVAGECQGPRPLEAGEHASSQAAHDRPALVVDVVEDELVDRHPVTTAREPFDQLGGVRAAAADDRDLDPHIASQGIDRLLITL